MSDVKELLKQEGPHRAQFEAAIAAAKRVGLHVRDYLQRSFNDSFNGMKIGKRLDAVHRLQSRMKHKINYAKGHKMLKMHEET
jgi:hypothetical protein